MTPSLLVLYTERAEDRVTAEATGRFDDMVSATRIGNADQKSYNRWRRARRARAARTERVLSGAALEQAIARVASIFPDNVMHGTV